MCAEGCKGRQDALVLGEPSGGWCYGGLNCAVLYFAVL